MSPPPVPVRCPLARDDMIPPCLAPVQDTEILGVEPEEPVLCEQAILSLRLCNLRGVRPFAGSQGGCFLVRSDRA